MFSRFLRSVAAALLFSLAPVFGIAQTISQPIDTGSGNGGSVGQSFVATLTGYVVAIDVREGLSDHITTLHFYNGANGSGVPGAVGAPALSIPGVTLTRVVSGGSFSHITLTTPFPVVAGTSYSFVFDSVGLFAPGGNLYANGTTLLNYATPSGGQDLAFQVFEVASADLQVSQTASIAAAPVGTTISYAVTFTNAGPSDAGTVTVADNLAAAGLALVGAQSSAGILTTTTNSVSLAVPAFASGASGTLTVVASVLAGAGSITHTVSISSATVTDGNTANNSAVNLASRLPAPVPPASAASIPTLSEWAMVLLASLMAGFAVLRMRRP